MTRESDEFFILKIILLPSDLGSITSFSRSLYRSNFGLNLQNSWYVIKPGFDSAPTHSLDKGYCNPLRRVKKFSDMKIISFG